ncbi:MAG TPA: malto-oligosyltrehalose synthase [Candidatus Acidoferrales bacterium]|nr:malto-oligosyltrehalose synthase [Candidatus Acidoferrales bacterium]
MRVPSATYRIQFHLNFRFADAEQIVPYMREMGITHLYASPWGRARRGSMHGYDVADPLHVNSELGTEEEFTSLVARLHKYGMGLILDIVPNHMAASDENPWWMDVLENGIESSYADYFDIDWDAPGAKSRDVQKNQVVLPVLNEQYDRVLFSQGIAIRLDEHGFYIHAQGNRIPVSPPTYFEILSPCSAVLRASSSISPELIREFESLLEIARTLARPPDDRLGVEKARPVLRLELKTRLWELYLRENAIRDAVGETLLRLNGIAGDAQSFSALDALLVQQPYRLAHWRTAAGEINYRRFFGLNHLVGVRVEDPRVFEATHAMVFRLVKENKVDGLRVDHIDGLLDPLEYLDRLQNARKVQPDDDSDALGIYTIVEKITSGDEELPKTWRVAGTTGYDFLNVANTLFIDPRGWHELEIVYRNFTGIHSTFADTWYIRKRQVMEELFGSDIRVLSSRLGRLAALDPRGRDLPMRELIRGLKEITARLPVYRTYIRDLVLPERDRPHLVAAIRSAHRRSVTTEVSEAVFDFFRRVFLLEPPCEPVPFRAAWLDFLTRWQQFSGAVMAKGLEDTAFFVHHGLLSLNEVGCNPFRRGIRFGIAAFHESNRRRQQEYPFTLNATSTHDTKWSEDVRARINVLSELPQEWHRRLARWSKLNRSKKKEVAGIPAPSPNEEVLLYQALLGIWPFTEPDLDEIRERIDGFLLKAVREAKTHSNWFSPNEEYEAAVRGFLASIFRPGSNTFLRDFLQFFEQIASRGACNAWSQLLLKITSPGIPDFYQGNGLWQFRLTDPDNRNLVDYRERTEALESLAAIKNGELCPRELLENWRDGRLKLYLAHKVLNFRGAHKELFMRGEYLPLHAIGPDKDSVCSFARKWKGAWTITVVPRLTAKLVKPGVFPVGEAVWARNSLNLPNGAPSVWANLLTGDSVAASRGSISLAKILSDFPFAFVTNET